MRHSIIAIALLLFFNLHSIAQVTIGSSEMPLGGALLDLKERNSLDTNSSRGVGLPRVNLEKATGLAPCVDEIAYPNERDKHVGLLVYNVAYVAAEDLCPGLYVWDGEAWQRLHGSCKAVVISNLASEYIMDGQEYSFTINSEDDWEATISDADNILTSTSALSGSKGEREFEFALSVKMDADATASITFGKKSDSNIKMAATIYGKKMTFVVPEDLVIKISGNTIQFPFAFSSNSTRPMMITEIPSWMIFDELQQTIRIPGNVSVSPGVYPITISNTATSKTVYVTLQGDAPIDPPVDPEIR